MHLLHKQNRLKEDKCKKYFYHFKWHCVYQELWNNKKLYIILSLKQGHRDKICCNQLPSQVTYLVQIKTTCVKSAADSLLHCFMLHQHCSNSHHTAIKHPRLYKTIMKKYRNDLNMAWYILLAWKIKISTNTVSNISRKL